MATQQHKIPLSLSLSNNNNNNNNKHECNDGWNMEKEGRREGYLYERERKQSSRLLGMGLDMGGFLYLAVFLCIGAGEASVRV